MNNCDQIKESIKDLMQEKERPEYCLWEKQSKILYEKYEEEDKAIIFKPIVFELEDKRTYCQLCFIDIMDYRLSENKFRKDLELHNLKCCRQCIACQPDEEKRKENARQCRLENCPVDYGKIPEAPLCLIICPHIPQKTDY